MHPFGDVYKRQARNCAKYGKLNITPKKDVYRVKRGGRKLFGLLA